MQKTLMACAIVAVMAATTFAGDPPQFMMEEFKIELGGVSKASK